MDATPTKASLQGVSSPYSSGGGGVSFERRVGAAYLALLLTGDGAPELGSGRAIVRVSFQQAPQSPVDDLVILAARAGEAEPSLHLAVGVRRRPRIIASNDDTRALISAYLRALLSFPADDSEHRFALVVAGPQPHAQQLALLCTRAAEHATPETFFSLMSAPRKFEAEIRVRLDAVTKLVKKALQDLDGAAPGDELAKTRTWELLSRLSVVMPRLEESDISDWIAAQNRLVRIARGANLDGAERLLDHLEGLAGEFGLGAAAIDLTLLRRRVHPLLEAGVGRRQQGWGVLEHLHDKCMADTRDRLTVGGSGETLKFDRTKESAVLLDRFSRSSGVVVYGDSGVGKSALVLGTTTDEAVAHPDETQVICLNLRQLPENTLDLIRTLGCPLNDCLNELTVPRRLLVIDGAEAALEERRDLFIYLAKAAQLSDVRVVAITSTEPDRLQALLAEYVDGDVALHEVHGLSDSELDEIGAQSPQLSRLLSHPRSRELLRRLVVIDLLMRSDISGTPLSDVDAMVEIWAGLVRRHEMHDRSHPDAREQVLLLLARRELFGESATTLIGELEPAAVEDLRHDGLLAQRSGSPFDVIPDFAHDEIRRYAMARILLADGDPTDALMRAGAPRPALSASQLACQAILGEGSRLPLSGRFGRVQAAFDTLVVSGYGARWGDVPSEALLTLADPKPLLADVWADLRSGDALGYKRLTRVVYQRHRNPFVDPIIAEPIVDLLVGEEAPWSTKAGAEFLREWLRALVIRNTPGGQPLRERLRDRLVSACNAGEQRLLERQAAAAKELEEHKAEYAERRREIEARHPGLFTEIGIGGRRERRQRPEVPEEFTDKVVLELFALLGPDLGDAGEQVLRRVASDAPHEMGPALEPLLTGRGLAMCRRGLLADLTVAYYLDEEEDGTEFHDDGVRDHVFTGFVRPDWSRGPFMDLFRSDLVGGTSILNRLLNHAALVRGRGASERSSLWGQASDSDLDMFKTELSITGAPRVYVGDSHVWLWYRGTGTGPYACMSALMALERTCDQLIAAGLPLERLIPLLLEGCENLAMPALVVGILVRHLERSGSLVDPFMAEPVVWHLEFVRLVNESSGLAGTSMGLIGSERRKWSFIDVAGWLVLNADVERSEELRAVGERLIGKPQQAQVQHSAPRSTIAATTPVEDDLLELRMAQTRNWASFLDRDRYRLYSDDGVTYVVGIPPASVESILAPGNKDLERGREAIRLTWRYFLRGNSSQNQEPPTEQELKTDLSTAVDLVRDPPASSPSDHWEAPTLVAKAALEAHLIRGMSLPRKSLAFAVETVLTVAEQPQPRSPYEFEGSYFEQGADRSAARALPLLLLPSAGKLRTASGTKGKRTGAERISEASRAMSHAVANEVRLQLARGLDAVWAAPCDSSPCHHETALALVIESMRDCILGAWDIASQHRRIDALPDPVSESLERVLSDDLYVERLDAAIRGLGAAILSSTCIEKSAHDLLTALLSAQRRGLAAREHVDDRGGNHSLVAARALLSLASIGDDGPLHAHIETLFEHGYLLTMMLYALAAAAEESQVPAEAARRVWPSIIEQVLGLARNSDQMFTDNYFGEASLAALVPMSPLDGTLMYREVDTEPVPWADPVAWHAALDDWLVVAAGHPRCVDALIGLIRTLPAADQLKLGLPWITTATIGDVDSVARGSYSLEEWLIQIQASITDASTRDAWQRLVDALVVAGATNLAPFSQ